MTVVSLIRSVIKLWFCGIGEAQMRGMPYWAGGFCLSQWEDSCSCWEPIGSKLFEVPSSSWNSLRLVGLIFTGFRWLRSRKSSQMFLLDCSCFLLSAIVGKYLFGARSKVQTKPWRVEQTRIENVCLGIIVMYQVWSGNVLVCLL